MSGGEGTSRRIRRRRLLVAGGVLGSAVIGLAALATRPEPGRPAAATASAAATPSARASDGDPTMVWIPGGRFRRGSDDLGDARPVSEVEVDGFWMDRTEVTNRQFAEFVRSTGYRTVAERAPDPKLYPGAPPELLVPGSIVFDPPAGPVDLGRPLSWWRYAPGADWRHPEGPGSTIAGKDDHPVVQVCWDDAVAYARWAGKRLPTEAEWEYAARGGLDRKRFVWGDEALPGGRRPANIWQGTFPVENTLDDGFRSTAPVGSFAPNGFGLYDMAGNVWEWCSDWYRPDAYASGPARNPAGPESSYDPDEPGVAKRVQRGGSFMCSDEYCTRYLPGARGKGAPDSAAWHIGFRCVRSGTGPLAATSPAGEAAGSPGPAAGSAVNLREAPTRQVAAQGRAGEPGR